MSARCTLCKTQFLGTDGKCPGCRLIELRHPGATVKPGPAITQGPDDAGDGAALRDAEGAAHRAQLADVARRNAERDAVAAREGLGVCARCGDLGKRGEHCAKCEAETQRNRAMGEQMDREHKAARPTLNRHPGELAMELLRYASANSPGAQLARPLTAYETHYAAHIAAFIHHGLRQAALALEGNDEAAGEALKLAMHEARRADAARRVVIHEDAIRDLVQL